jgi:uncharacterized damage-inducible protein DinB
MLQEPLVRVLFDYEVWATRQLLGACQALAPEQWERPSGLGHGSLARTLTHQVSSMLFFTDRLKRQPARPRLEHDGQTYTAAELGDHFARAAEELRQAVALALERHALSDPLHWTDSDEGEIAAEDTITYAVALAQIIDHGIHHRTQAMDMLRLLGVALPMEWHPFDWDEAVRLGR